MRKFIKGNDKVTTTKNKEEENAVSISKYCQLIFHDFAIYQCEQGALFSKLALVKIGICQQCIRRG